MAGIIFALVCSAFGGISNVGLRRGALTGLALQGLVITVLIGVPLFFIAALVSGQIFRYASISPTNYLILALAGVIHYVVGRYTIIRAVDAIGTTRATPALQLSTLVSVMAAIFFLSETVTLLMSIGIFLVIVGPLIALQKTAQPASSEEPTPRLLAGYTWCVINALAFGISPVLIRHALEDSGAGLGILGGLVAYVAGAILLLPIILSPARLRGMVRMDRVSQRWFLFAALTLFLGHMFYFLALSQSPVSVVIPLMQSRAIFSLLFAFVLSRQVESFSPKVLSGIAISVVGAISLVW